ncbi:redoxin family protein [Alicyclobacillus fastidiosus]|uniref:Redoxin domain-containing protein n=1 Tax=Alicyclobacillus fastidiosus TaxID=392011 RepID=A0ABV5ADP1_9BACL|nr:redoxin family protein [Alicyclobacillus fastidiosus]WEH08604.1 redoxin domain-containing protein [Alicyclobacillus fastidiosus]
MPMRLGSDFPSLEGATQWFNDEPVLEEGKVTFVHFWAVSCHICHETMAEVLRIRDEYASKGLQTIAVHMPRMEEDTDVERIRKDIEKYGITQPCAVDNQIAIAQAFQNEFTPAFFVFGRDRKLLFRTAGDKGFQKVEPKVREALGLD